ncbi:zinc ABC transporter substrate-binding protein [bacterium]|nr:zinc ABC transporter substrate-binding protein [bacterium]
MHKIWRSLGTLLLVLVVIIGGWWALFRLGRSSATPLVPAPASPATTRLSLVASNFAAYDFLRAIIGDVPGISLQLLVPPGVDSHSYDPTPGDIIALTNCDLLVYNGGQMESWLEQLLPTLDRPGQTLRLSDLVAVQEEMSVDDAQAEADSDEPENNFEEHIWTSPAMVMVLVQNCATLSLLSIPPTSHNI